MFGSNICITDIKLTRRPNLVNSLLDFYRCKICLDKDHGNENKIKKYRNQNCFY